MDIHMKAELIDLANELRLAGSAIAELSHRADRVYCDSLGEALNAKDLSKTLQDRVNRLNDAVEDLRGVEACLLRDSLDLAIIAEMDGEKRK